MISRVVIDNFRSHKHTDLCFGEGVTVIVGRGQSGKTNIRRAIEWVRYNRPLGDRIHSTWMGKKDATSVAVTMISGYSVIATKAKKGSIVYTVISPSGEKDIYNKVGKSVPDRVIDILGINEINLQGQLDQPFLISGGSGDISRAVNSVVDLEVADKWLSDLNKRKLGVGRDVRSKEKEREEAENVLSGYSELPSVGRLLASAGKLQRSADLKRALLEEVRTIIDGIRDAEKGLSAVSSIGAVEDLLGTMRAVCSQIQQKQGALDHCRQLVRDWKLLSEVQNEQARILDDYRDVLSRSKVCPTCNQDMSDLVIDGMVHNCGGL